MVGADFMHAWTCMPLFFDSAWALAVLEKKKVMEVDRGRALALYVNGRGFDSLLY